MFSLRVRFEKFPDSDPENFKFLDPNPVWTRCALLIVCTLIEMDAFCIHRDAYCVHRGDLILT